MNYGTTGVGAANHLVTELFDSNAGIRMTHIPYRGTALAVTDLLAGHVQVVFSDPITALPQITAGALLALAVTSRERSPVAPDVPTIAESGYPGFDAIAWHGILAPASTPPAIVSKLNAEIVAALKDPETRELLEKQAMETVGNSPEAFTAFIRDDIADVAGGRDTGERDGPVGARLIRPRVPRPRARRLPSSAAPASVLSQRFAGERRAVDQSPQFRPGDLRMRAPTEAAIGAGDDVFLADQPGVALQALRHQIRDVR